ncbi:conserved membrane hypothetical protein [Candidatus Zixiibacteriota bacterium]|nr:conserved membrane hypothetical protein [candidate division Zixibacteria bacterium]
MSSNIYFEIAAILLLILANGLFVLIEFSVIASRKSKLKRMAKHGNRAAARAEKLHSRPEAFLATVQVGITFVGTLAGVFSGMTIVNYLAPVIAKIPMESVANSARPISFIIIVVVISILSMIIGELVPKYIALSRPERIASSLSGFVNFLIFLTHYLIRFLSGTARMFIKLLGLKPSADGGAVTEDEINYMIAEGFEKGIFDATEKAIIKSVFDFSDTVARQAMTPRTDIIGVDFNFETSKLLQIITENGFSRYPVYDGTLDNIVGVIYTKDIIRVMQHSELIIIRDIIRKPLFVPDSMKLNILLGMFKQKRMHVAIVLDEFGGTAGLITLEDLLEEIVGEIQDEHDTDQSEYTRKSDNVAFAAGTFRIDDLNEQFETDLPEDGANTLAGLVFEKLGRPAVKGDEITVRQVKFTVLETKGNRLRRLRIEKIPVKKDID